MNKPNNLNKIHRHLGKFQVVDYECFGAKEVPSEKECLYLHYDETDKKVYVCSGDTVFGSLKLTGLDFKYISAIALANPCLLECQKVPTDDNATLEQKFWVSVWIKKVPIVVCDENVCLKVKIPVNQGEKEIEVKADSLTCSDSCTVQDTEKNIPVKQIELKNVCFANGQQSACDCIIKDFTITGLQSMLKCFTKK